MRESPQAREFKKLLPEDLQKVAEVSFSYQTYWKIISDHLQTLYGKYADPQYCLDSYFKSEAYKENKQVIHRCSDLPLIGIDDIQNMLAEEKEYTKTVQELLLLRGDMEKPGNVKKMASLLGILPHEDPRALYQNLIVKKDIPLEAWSTIRENISRHWNLVEVITDVLSRSFLPGYLLEFPAVGSVMTQPRNKYYYRGENAYFRKSTASLFRKSDENIPKELQSIVDRLRLYQCWETLDCFDVVKYWGSSEPNYMALAQHYGLRTQMMDITSDFKTALFFACCKFGKDRKWHPLTAESFSHRNSRKYISAGCNGDSRYGILYRSPSEITDIRWSIEQEGTADEIIIPVGYQPFMRCSQQHGYMLLTWPGYDLYKDYRFDKFKFRLSEDICNWIYEEMERGDAIYPVDDIPDISEEIESINHQSEFSSNIFEELLHDLKLQDPEASTLKEILRQHGIVIQHSVSVVVPEKIKRINKSYTVRSVMSRIGIDPKLCPMLHIPGNTQVDSDGNFVPPEQ